MRRPLEKPVSRTEKVCRHHRNQHRLLGARDLCNRRICVLTIVAIDSKEKRSLLSLEIGNVRRSRSSKSLRQIRIVGRTDCIFRIVSNALEIDEIEGCKALEGMHGGVDIECQGRKLETRRTDNRRLIRIRRPQERTCVLVCVDR